MLRSVYIALLGLHPPGFRRRFGDEMLSIFDEQAAGRPSLKMLWDAALSLIRQWILRSEFWYGIPLAHDTEPAANGVPTFYTIDRFRPRPGALIHGLVLTTVVFSLTCFAIRYSWIHLLHVQIPELEFSPQSPSGTSSDGGFVLPTPVLSQSESDAHIPVARQSTESNPSGHDPANKAALSPQVSQPAWMPVPPHRSRALRQKFTQQAELGPGERHQIIQAAAEELKRSYVDRDVARGMAAFISAHERRGDYDQITDRASLAQLLTKDMRDVSHDPHLVMAFSATPLPIVGAPSSAKMLQYRQAMAKLNCTFERVEILPHNIGYMKLNSFPDPAVCGSVAQAAMASLNGADAVVFDLRDNHGGYPEMVALIAAYLFDHPEYFYNPRETTTAKSWTKSPVPGSRLADKPVYILTSGQTYSGAEQFTYDLKMLKRATIVGEATGGAAHAGVWHRINDHFGIGIPETKAINPFSSDDWAETGVEPDIKIAAVDALPAAEELAAARLTRK